MSRYLNFALLVLVLGFVVPVSVNAETTAGAPVAVATKAEDPKADASKAEASKEEGAKSSDSNKIETDEEAAGVASSLHKALMDRDWSLVLSFGLTLFVFGLRKFKLLDKVPTKVMPWVVAGISVVSYVAAALLVPGAVLGTAIMQGLATGAASVGLYEMVLKRFLSNKSS